MPGPDSAGTNIETNKKGSSGISGEPIILSFRQRAPLCGPYERRPNKGKAPLVYPRRQNKARVFARRPLAQGYKPSGQSLAGPQHKSWGPESKTQSQNPVRCTSYSFRLYRFVGKGLRFLCRKERRPRNDSLMKPPHEGFQNGFLVSPETPDEPF